ncbi:hypothetical protein PXK56_18350 [Phaeobacter gallaeciensis]|uniref:hypothetical protein n=1 Tax=Phaeobacter gallaeciensis TaxID=60890 RepID=UPI0023801B3D|nr:hypothetical protein [Phaeobacter gallaeciensis]MDE4297149.1 hypothetical protein [Phaeobacter gallaeciensis]
MTEFRAILVEADGLVEEDFELPSYGTPGWVLVEILGPGATDVYRYETDNYAVSEEASTFWITEGVGIDYWLDMMAPNLAPGWWVFENVVGTYIRGQGWISGEICEEDDEEWEYGFVRPATQIEIDTQEVVTCPGL